MIKVGLVGIGGMGNVHFNSYKSLEDVKIVAVADVRTDMAKEKVNDDNINIYSSIDELLEAEQLDVIDICTPSFMHCEMSIKALEYGAHVLCEKPMSLSSKETAKIIEAVKKSGKLFMTAHVVRFMQPYMYLKSVVESGELGKIVRLDMKRLSAIPLWSWEDWMRDTKKSGGTPLDLSIHDIDFAQYLFGEPKTVNGIYRKLTDNNDYMISNLIYDDFTVSAEGTWYNTEIPFEASFYAIFQNGTVRLKDGKVYKNGEAVDLASEDASSDTGINISITDGYPYEIEYFINCVKTNVKPTVVTPESSQNSVKLVERILENTIIL